MIVAEPPDDEFATNPESAERCSDRPRRITMAPPTQEFNVMPSPADFRCFVIRQSPDGTDGTVTADIERRSITDLPPGDLVVQVRASSLNYKDALAVSGHPGITKSFPHVPGIDAWGTVVQSDDDRFTVGQDVLVTGHELGVERWGGWSEFIRVPGAWALPLPDGLTGRECMELGTAGFTAAQCVAALVRNNVRPDSGDLVVTGATGGVASLSIVLLSQLGYRVIAITGKQEQTDWLKTLGAAEVVPRETLATSARPLLSARYAGGVDTVGGAMLTSLIKQTSQRGCIAACGVAGGHELPLTVYPFILRGVTLAGIDSAWCPLPERQEIWRRLGAEWKIKNLSTLCRTIPLTEASSAAKNMLLGRTIGRTVISLEAP